MVNAANKETYSLINPMAIAISISHYIYFCQEDDDDDCDIGKHDFSLVLLHPLLSNANRSSKRSFGIGSRHFVILKLTIG